MDDASLNLLLGSIAEQQYRFKNLLKLLIEKKVIASGEMDSVFDEKEKLQFTHDLLEHLVATGLKISGSLPSSSTQELPSGVEAAGKDASDPTSETNS